jgi:hypothetical protein
MPCRSDRLSWVSGSVVSSTFPTPALRRQRISVAIREYPLEPDLHNCRKVTPEDRRNKRESLGILYLLPLGDNILGPMRVDELCDRRVADLLDARLCTEKFERPADFDLGGFWKSWCAEEEQSFSGYPVTARVTKRALPSVIRRFGAGVRDQLADAPECEDGSCILILYFRWIDEARDRLLPFGSGVEVLEPYAMRASIADTAEQTARLYGK